MLPEESVDGLAGESVSAVPSYVAVIAVLAGKPEPVTVTVSLPVPENVCVTVVPAGPVTVWSTVPLLSQSTLNVNPAA